jgi:hypothetical protein
LCRFNGHCRVFYSVAEHCVRVSERLPSELARWGLLHDAAEAYLSDLPRPIKSKMPWFRRVEDRLLALIAERFELAWPMPAAVAEVDSRLLATEARDLMRRPPAAWELGVEPYPEPIAPWQAGRAERRFLDRYAELARG